MAKAFEIDFPRQAILQTLNQEHIKNPYFIGGANQVAITSFYEHLASDDEVNRYVEVVRDLTNQQNRTGLIANGVIVAPSNPTITNLNQCTIIPMDFTVNFRCTLGDRDLVKTSLDNMVSILKGRKQDICEFDNGKLFMVGTLGNNINGMPLIRNGDFIGIVPTTNPATDLDTYISDKIDDLVTYKGFLSIVTDLGSYLYYEDTDGKLKVAVYEYDEDSDENKWFSKNETNDYPNIIFPPEHNSFTKWKLSMSFDTSRCSEPRTLNAEDYCDISFGGSATLVNASVMLGNEMTKLGIRRLGVITEDNQRVISGLVANPTDNEYTWIEPLELPSGNSAETQMNQLVTNNFVNNTHTNSLSLNLQYTFVLDNSINILKEFFKYARYGTQSYTSPNMIYEMLEMWSSWGVVDNCIFKTKIVESIDIENTESDTLTITLPMQIQGNYY